MSDDYVVGGATARTRTRRRRAAITLTVVALLLFGAFWYAYSYYRNPPAAGATARPTGACTTKAPAKVTVNVYNATGRDGLAGRTADELKTRGFTIGRVSNDPLGKIIKASAEVRYGKAGATASTRVAAVVSKPTRVVDKRKDASVDLVLGNGFKALAAAPKTAATCR